MEYEVVRLDANGDGYIVVTRDDGTSFGQNVKGCKAQSQQELDDYVLDLTREVDEKESWHRMTVPTVVRNLVGGKRTPVRRP